MGFNNENAGRWLAFDCETVGIAEAPAFMEPVTAPSNYKDLDKIAAYIQERTAALLDRAALDVDLARVVALALQVDIATEPLVLTASSEVEERALLTTFWDVVERVQGQRLVGFNIRRYDLPLVMRRSQLLGVTYPAITIDRPWRAPQVCDLYDVLTFNGTIDGKKLVTYCKRFGIDVEDEVTGAEVAECIANGAWDLVRQHAKADVQRVVALAARLGCISRRLAEVA